MNDISRAVNYALSHTGGGAEALAHIILAAEGCYSSSRCLDISEMCILDQEKQSWAWRILQNRVDGERPSASVPKCDLAALWARYGDTA